MLNHVKTVIYSKTYTLSTKEPPEYVQNLGRRLETKIDEMATATGFAQFDSTIMVGLALLHEADDANRTIEGFRNQIKGYVHEAGIAKLERDAALRDVEILRAKLSGYESDDNLRKLAENFD